MYDVHIQIGFTRETQKRAEVAPLEAGRYATHTTTTKEQSSGLAESNRETGLICVLHRTTVPILSFSI